MAQRRTSGKPYVAPIGVSANGSSEDHLAFAETAAPEQDIPDDEQEEIETAKPTILDLDAALGDEDALRHELLDTGPMPIEVRIPRRREYFAVHPTYQRVAEVVEYAPDGKLQPSYYLVAAAMKHMIESEDKKTVQLVLCQSMRSRAWFWWPLNLDMYGAENPWNRDSRKVADDIRARQYYGRRLSLKPEKGYTTKWAPDGHPAPTWPDKSRDELLFEAFINAGRYIDSVTHPVYLDIEGAV